MLWKFLCRSSWIWFDSFGEKVEKFRKKMGLSYRELAQKCDVDHSNISKIENGEVDLNFNNTGTS